jgi:hypothetical protein
VRRPRQNTLAENRLRRAVTDEFLAGGIESTAAASDWSSVWVYRDELTQEIGNNPDKDVTKAIDQAFKKFPVKENSK